MITEKNKNRVFVVRCSTETHTANILKRNYEFLKFLHYSNDLPYLLKQKIPNPLVEYRFNNSLNIQIETYLDGFLAWKIIRAEIRKNTYKTALEFYKQLYKFTRKKYDLNLDILKELFDRDLQILREFKFADNPLKDTVSRSIGNILEFFKEKKGYLAVSHGDYGYGNILVDERNGSVNGVIDWDTGRKMEFPGIDLLNLEIQRHRNEYKISLVDAFKIVSNKCISGEFKYLRKDIDIIDKDYIPEQIYWYLMNICLIRFVIRSMQYPEIFKKYETQFIDSFKWLHLICPERSRKATNQGRKQKPSIFFK
jgi:thiamine kinase-like enzyme